MYDVIVIGGGAAGLNSALVLARACRKVVVIDDGHPRNESSHSMYNFLTRDGIHPKEFLKIARDEVTSYGVPVVNDRVLKARCTKSEGKSTSFSVETKKGDTLEGRRLIIATGVSDVLPEIINFNEYYGKGIHHCPYCDGYEYREKKIVTFGDGDAAVGLALLLAAWSKDVTACTQEVLPARDKVETARKNGIELKSGRIAEILGDGSVMTAVKFEDGEVLQCDAFFFNTDQSQQSELPRMLGCDFDSDSAVSTTEKKQRTSVQGVYLAGDADDGVQFIVSAAAEGAVAAVAVNNSLQEEDQL